MGGAIALAWKCMNFPHSPVFAVAAISMAALYAAPLQGQATASPTAEFRRARALYYTPVDRGLLGFTCDVGFNWKQFIEKANSGPVQDTDERLIYLRSIKLSVADDLNGAGQLQWAAPTTAPDASEGSIAQIRSGMQAMWSGFFQSWNGFYTGDLVSLGDNKTTVERTAGGYHVFTTQNGKLAEENYDKGLTLLSLHVSTPTLDSYLTPIFLDTAQGRLVTNLNSVVKQPPSAPGTRIDMTVHYAAVNGFQLPAELAIDVADAAKFDFTLNNCTVRTQLSSAPSH